MAHELGKYNIDIAALQESRLHGEDSLTESGEGYTFFWKGLPEGERSIHGVSFAVKTSLLQQIPETPIGISERLMTWRLPLAKSQYATLVCAYAPTEVDSNEQKDHFYELLDSTLRNIPRLDKLILLGDMNARVGSDYQVWPNVLGRHGTGSSNNNGLRLLTLCTTFELCITNTIFQQKNMHKCTWQHPRSKHWHLIDYAIVNQRNCKEVLHTRVMRGADCWTDHRLVKTTLRLTIRPPQRKQAPRRKVNIQSLKCQETRTNLRSYIASHLGTESNAEETDETSDTGPTDEWNSLKDILLQAGENVLGYTKRKNQDWFDTNAHDIHALLKKKTRPRQSTTRKSIL